MAVYLVKSPDGKERLVDAANRASARNHVAKSVLDVAVAKQADLFRVAKAGGDIETAGEVVAEGGDEQQPQGDEQLGGEGQPSGDEPPAGEAPAAGGKKK